MVSSEIKASIIIPARNAMATIEKTVQSVLDEVCSEDVETIIANDGLENFTAKFAESYPVRVIDGDGSTIS